MLIFPSISKLLVYGLRGEGGGMGYNHESLKNIIAAGAKVLNDTLSEYKSSKFSLIS